MRISIIVIALFLNLGRAAAQIQSDTIRLADIHQIIVDQQRHIIQKIWDLHLKGELNMYADFNLDSSYSFAAYEQNVETLIDEQAYFDSITMAGFKDQVNRTFDTCNPWYWPIGAEFNGSSEIGVSAGDTTEYIDPYPFKLGLSNLFVGYRYTRKGWDHGLQARCIGLEYPCFTASGITLGNTPTFYFSLADIETHLTETEVQFLRSITSIMALSRKLLPDYEYDNVMHYSDHNYHLSKVGRSNEIILTFSPITDSIISNAISEGFGNILDKHDNFAFPVYRSEKLRRPYRSVTQAIGSTYSGSSPCDPYELITMMYTNGGIIYSNLIFTRIKDSYVASLTVERYHNDDLELGSICYDFESMRDLNNPTITWFMEWVMENCLNRSNE